MTESDNADGPNGTDNEDADLDLEAAENPLNALKEAYIGVDNVPWVAEVIVEIDAETAKRFRPAFEQALEEGGEEQLLDLVHNEGLVERRLLIDGYDPEYFFDETEQE